MQTNKLYERHTYSYLGLRKAVGWIGVLLPFALVLGSVIFFGAGSLQRSISHYYYSPLRDVLVGALCAVGLFLFFYSGYDKTDNLAGSLAGFFAIGVAWFPATETGPSDTTGQIHTVFTLLFFLTLVFFALFLFTRSVPEPTSQKLKRNTIYRVTGWTIVACLLAIQIYHQFFFADYPTAPVVFWAETIALEAFGLSWLTKGQTLYPDK